MGRGEDECSVFPLPSWEREGPAAKQREGEGERDGPFGGANMQIAVFGAGAVGGYLAAKLALDGHEVALVARGAALAAIRAQGLMLQDESGERIVRLRAVEKAQELGPQP